MGMTRAQFLNGRMVYRSQYDRLIIILAANASRQPSLLPICILSHLADAASNVFGMKEEVGQIILKEEKGTFAALLVAEANINTANAEVRNLNNHAILISMKYRHLLHYRVTSNCNFLNTVRTMLSRAEGELLHKRSGPILYGSVESVM
jgi:hypothetical protein